MRTKHTFRLPPDLASKLADYANRKGVPQALVVEAALASHLSPDGADRLHPPTDTPAFSGTFPPDWMDLIPDLDRQPSDVVVLKRQWGAFYGTDLDLQLRRRARTAIVLCGIATEIGVESTARDAYERGYELVFASDAVAGMSPEAHANSLERIFPRMGRVRTTDEIIAALKS